MRHCQYTKICNSFAWYHFNGSKLPFIPHGTGATLKSENAVFCNLYGFVCYLKFAFVSIVYNWQNWCVCQLQFIYGKFVQSIVKLHGENTTMRSVISDRLRLAISFVLSFTVDFIKNNRFFFT